ncbi:MAG: class I SAM-dependent methyltransferase [Rhodopila sp.]
MSDRFYDAGASGYDEIFGFASRQFVPTLLKLARIEAGDRVLDVATGTGVAAEEASDLAGPSGSVLAVDISAPMLEEARKRLAHRPNISFSVEDGQDLQVPSETVDVVVCALGLMFFPDHTKGIAEFFRVLRSGGRAAASVITSPRRSIHGRVRAAIANRIAPASSRVRHSFALGEEQVLRELFDAGGFRQVDTLKELRVFPFKSFDAFFDPIDNGVGYIGQEWLTLPPDVRRLVREDVRRDLAEHIGQGGTFEIPFEVSFVSGRKL